MENENNVQQAPVNGASAEKKPFRANNQNRKRKKVCQFCVERLKKSTTRKQASSVSSLPSALRSFPVV